MINNDFICSWHDVAWATHQPVLHRMCCKDDAKILEFGCGVFSSKLLQWLQPQYNLQIEAFESDKTWIDKVKLEHNISYPINLVNWNTHWEDLDSTGIIEHYDTIFIDQAPWEAREETIKRFKDKCDHVVLHDCDFCPEYNMFEYSDYFKYWKIFLPPEPWPWKTGPPTLLASNFEDVTNIKISYERVLNER